MKYFPVGRILQQAPTLQGGVTSFGGGQVKMIMKKERGME